MTESPTTSRPTILQRLYSALPVILVIAFLLYLRNPLSASPGDPPAAHQGAVYDLGFSPL